MTKEGDIVPNIDDSFAERLFSLWMNGKTYTELASLYGDDPRYNLTYKMVVEIAKRYEWHKRRKEIVGRLRQDNDDNIFMEKRKQLYAFSQMIDMNVQAVQSVYKDFIENPQGFLENDEQMKKAWWMVKDLFTFREFLGMFKDITNNEQPEQMVGGGATINIANIDPQMLSTIQVREKMTSILKEAADSRHVIDSANTPLELTAVGAKNDKKD